MYLADNKKIRLSYWDNIKGFLIILVVFAHCLIDFTSSYLNNVIITFIYMFHMSVFVFVSGFFTKSLNSRSFNSLFKLFVAFIFLQALFIFYEIFFNNKIPSSTITLYSSWYIFALIIWRITAPYLAKIKYIIPVLFLISFLSMFCPDINMQFAFVKIIMFYPFFMSGYLIKPEITDKLINLSSFNKYSLGFLLLFIAINTGIFLYNKFNITINDLTTFSYPNLEINNIISRISIYFISFVMLIVIMLFAVEKKFPLITNSGKNSFAIYLLHRPFTFVFFALAKEYSTENQIMLGIIFTLLMCLIAGSDIISNFIKHILDNCCSVISESGQKINKILYGFFILSLIVFIIIMPVIAKIQPKSYSDSEDKKYRIIDEHLVNKSKKDFKIIFTGDLILLEDQVKRAYDGNQYNFKEYFEYAKEYISEADLAIGVLEGPFGGNIKNYSQSNYDDGKFLYLNFPDEFADEIKNAGFDLVTTANNHVLDMNFAGAKRTIEILKQKGIEYTGSYIDMKDKKQNHIKLIEKNGLKIAVLSYTYGVNYYNEENLFSGKNSYITSLLPSPESIFFETAKQMVQEDFIEAKKYNPDLIIVLPHWGTQFANKADKYQLIWQENFIKNGADIILGCHTHSVQDVFIRDNKFTLFSAGNFANIYREYNGDASIMVEVYIDRKNKKPYLGAIIPMWTNSAINGNYTAIPIYKILTDNKTKQQITTYDLKRVKEVFEHITNIVLGEKLDLSLVQKRYYFDEFGFLRTKTQPLKIEENMKNTFYNMIKEYKNVCFIGDSITEGTKNGGAAWFEPIEYLIKGVVQNKSWGGETSKLLITKHLQEIISTKADLYVIAIGTNDIRYRNSKICAMNSSEYIDNLNKLKQEILKNNPNAKFIFIAPWISTDGDIYSKIPYQTKLLLNEEYSKELEKWSKSNGDTCINPNKHIGGYLDKYPREKYLIDYIHPNSTEGIKLYSEAVLNYKK